MTCLQDWTKRNAKRLLEIGDWGLGYSALSICPLVRLSESEQASIDGANAHVRDLIKKEEELKKGV